MARASNEKDIRVGGMKLGARFALTTSAFAVVVMGIASVLLHNATNRATEKVRSTVVSDSMYLTSELDLRHDVEFVGGKWELMEGGLMRYKASHEGGDAHIYQIDRVERETDEESQKKQPPIRLAVPLEYGGDSDDLLGLIVGIAARHSDARHHAHEPVGPWIGDRQIRCRADDAGTAGGRR